MPLDVLACGVDVMGPSSGERGRICCVGGDGEPSRASELADDADEPSGVGVAGGSAVCAMS